MREAGLDHDSVQERVAAFADRELPAQEQRVVEEHLRACPICQRELALQRGISRALAGEPETKASAVLRRRIEQIGAPMARRTAWHRRWAASAAAAAALVLIAVGGGIGLRGYLARQAVPADIPLVRDALADCRRAMGRNFPRRADLRGVSEGLQFPVRPLAPATDAELFSTWKTTLAGSPAAGLAYRWKGIVVVQYAFPAELIRERRAMDEALRKSGFYAASDGREGILAFVSAGTGSLLVAEVPPEELRRLVL